MIKEDNYTKYRGKCKEFVDAAIRADSTLIAVRGFYFDPFWGEQQHWWCKRQDGTIYDPTKDQFPSKGQGHYEEFNGICTCENCGKDIPEEKAIFAGNYPCCSQRCACRLVGL